MLEESHIALCEEILKYHRGEIPELPPADVLRDALAELRRTRAPEKSAKATRAKTLDIDIDSF